jgi:hypothetical protein
MIDVSFPKPNNTSVKGVILAGGAGKGQKMGHWEDEKVCKR